jgi:hypothetical protein
MGRACSMALTCERDLQVNSHHGTGRRFDESGIALGAKPYHVDILGEL